MLDKEIDDGSIGSEKKKKKEILTPYSPPHLTLHLSLNKERPFRE